MSNDVPLGRPYNVVFYSLLTQMLAAVTGMVADEFIWVGGDVHVYNNQWKGVEEQIARTSSGKHPRIVLNPEIRNIFDFKIEDFKVRDYTPQPKIRYPKAAV